MNILIVEDDPILRDLFEKELKFLGHTVDAFQDAETALEVYQATYYPLILLDLGLPGMSGLEFCRHIRELVWGKESFVLIITANDALEDVQHALDVGADDYLMKPIKRKELAVRLMIFERQITQRAQHRKYQRLIENAPDPIVVIDGNSGAIVDMNATGCQELGYWRSQIVSKRFPELVENAADFALWHEFVEMVKEQGRLIKPLRFRRQDGTEFPVECHFSLALQGNQSYLLAVARDTTHRPSK